MVILLRDLEAELASEEMLCVSEEELERVLFLAEEEPEKLPLCPYKIPSTLLASSAERVLLLMLSCWETEDAGSRDLPLDCNEEGEAFGEEDFIG